MNRTIIISVISIITIVMIIGVISPALANNGNNGCEKANPNSVACESNPNTTPEEIICLDCLDTYWDSINSCNDDSVCKGAAYTTVLECFEKFYESTGNVCSFDERGR